MEDFLLLLKQICQFNKANHLFYNYTSFYKDVFKIISWFKKLINLAIMNKDTAVPQMNSYILHTHCSGFGRICSNFISPLAFTDMTSWPPENKSTRNGIAWTVTLFAPAITEINSAVFSMTVNLLENRGIELEIQKSHITKNFKYCNHEMS